MDQWTGKRLREFRKLQGWSQDQLAKKIGITAVTVHRMEKSADAILPQKVTLLLEALEPKPALAPPRPTNYTREAVPEAAKATLNELIEKSLA